MPWLWKTLPSCPRTLLNTRKSSQRQRGVTGDTAVRLGAFFNTTSEFWMNLQKTYELRLAEKALPGRVRKHIKQQREALVEA